MVRLPSCVAIVLAFVALALESPVRADDAKLPVLRHLLYAVSVGMNGRSESHVQDSLQPMPGTQGGTRLPRQGDTITQTASAHSEGRIVADVVAATLDSGLVIDVTEDAETRSRHVVRVGVHSNGRLDYPPEADVSEEETHLLRLLARAIVPAHLEPGLTWNVDEDGADYVWRTNFRVVEMRSPDDVNLEMASSLSDRAAAGISVASSGKIEYDPARDVPLKVRLDTRSRRQAGTVLVTTDLTISLDLLDDTFAKSRQ